MRITKHWQLMATDAKVKAIRAVYEPGYSSAQIASLINGATRNSIISIYHRYPNEFTDCPLLPRYGGRGKGAAKPRKGPARAPRIVRMPTVKSTLVPHQKLVEPKPAPEPVIAPEFRLVSLFELGRNECKWPVSGYGESARFCGYRTHEPDKPYCEFHRQMSVARP